MNYYCYANGKILRKNEIKAGITDLVMLRGYGAFDYMRTSFGVPFRINDYLNRFEQSEKGINPMLHEHKREMAKVKTTNYRTAFRLGDERRKANAQETLYCSDGEV